MRDHLTTDTDETQRTDNHPAETAIDWEQAQEGARLLLDAVGVDTMDETLVETWSRRVPATFETLTEGGREAAKPSMRTFGAASDDFVVKTGIPLYSLCEHHLLPYYGEAYVGYRPGGGVVGLSKLSRYVRWQSRELTIQEGLTRDIATGLAEEISAEGVVVELHATHLCEAMRGVETATETVTRTTVGDLTDAEQRRFDQHVRTTE
ncbi:GTP cyclohydrolase I [Halosimplex amylolyticum]|uniref:GTP cyclohydrolase I n=1 Tax=Halosimplex amylolyticum TaxID=3396616 RepID=UPI003F55CB70